MPAARTEAEACEAYEAVRRFCEEQTGWKTTSRRIYCLRYRRDGIQYMAQVGSDDCTEGLVVCIFFARPAFLVCTPDRGVLRGEPIIVGHGEVSYVEDFDD